MSEPHWPSSALRAQLWLLGCGFLSVEAVAMAGRPAAALLLAAGLGGAASTLARGTVRPREIVCAALLAAAPALVLGFYDAILDWLTLGAWLAARWRRALADWLGTTAIVSVLALSLRAIRARRGAGATSAPRRSPT